MTVTQMSVDHSPSCVGGDAHLQLGGTTNVDLIDRFCAHLRYRNLSPATIRRRRDCLGLFQRFIDPTPLERARAVDIEDFLATRRAPRTKHGYRSDLRVFYSWLVAKEVIDKSPASGIASVRVPKALPRPISVEDAMGALTFGSLRIRRMVGLAFFAGLRCKEISELHAEDIWTHLPQPVLVVRNGKGAKDRAVPMHPELVSLLRGLPTSGLVFPGRSGAPFHRDTVSKAINAHLRVAGIDGTAHQLRHSFGTELARVTGGNLVMVATFMGHESTNTTMGYVKLAAVGGAEAVGAMYGDAA